MNRQKFLYVTLSSTIFFYSFGMQPIVYPPDYFKSIATRMNRRYELLRDNPEKYVYLNPLLSEDEQQLKIHAPKYIQQLIKNPSYSIEQKQQLLKDYFPSNDTILAEYLYQGLEAIKKNAKQLKNLYLLNQITQQQYSEKPIERLVYTPTYFQDMLIAMTQTQDITEKEALRKQLRKDATRLINQIASDTSLKLEKKLTQIEQYLGQDTTFYLEETLKHNQPTMIISVIPKEKAPQGTATVEEVSSSEEEQQEILEQPIAREQQPQSPSFAKSRVYPEPVKGEDRQQPQEQPQGWLSTIWSGITKLYDNVAYIMSTIYYFFSWIRTEFHGSPPGSPRG